MALLSLQEMYKKGNEAYFNANVNGLQLNDEEFDYIKQTLGIPDDVVGKLPKSRERVTLPIWMGSMDKKLTNADITRFLKKTEATTLNIQDKMDGISCLYNAQTSKLYTRGNGVIGTDITRFIVPLRIPQVNGQFLVRGEIVIPLKSFDKFKHEFNNPRNMVSGVINSLNPLEKHLAALEFVAYELIQVPLSSAQLPPSKQIGVLQNFGFNVVDSCIHTLSGDEQEYEMFFNDLLDTRKSESIYDIDGIVVLNDVSYVRETSKNPTHGFAFKHKISSVSNTTVTKIEWTVQKDGKLVPVIHFNPIYLKNVCVTKATGYNAKFIVVNSIDKGAEIVVTRSGDTIPKVLAVIKPAKHVHLPTNKWDNSNTHLYTIAVSPNMIIKQILYFFKSLKIDGVGPSVAEKLYNNGLTSLDDIILRSSLDVYQTAIGNTTGSKVYYQFVEIMKGCTISEFLAALCWFGSGFSLTKILALNLEINNGIVKPPVNGVSDEKLKEIEPLITGGITFFKSMKKHFGCTVKSTTVDKQKSPLRAGHIYSTKKDSPHFQVELPIVVFSGFRDSSLETLLKQKGFKVGNSVTKETSYVIVKSHDQSTVKTEKAKKYGIPIIEISSFLKKF